MQVKGWVIARLNPSGIPRKIDQRVKERIYENA
jgi:hypothetical protein